MNRKIAVFIVGLLALGALEFGLLGASASGFAGGSGGHALPPLAERGPAHATATPVVTSPAAPYSIELLQPVPAAIECDGQQPSRLHVFVRDSNGNAVADGWPVKFFVFDGSASPPYVPTQAGSAFTSVVIYSDSYSLRPNVEVRVGELETAIRLRCIPNSGCPLSPPIASPPCGAPTPTPYPCNPSPGAGPMSPPCEIVPPSPPICAPNQTSPPCDPQSPPPCNPSPSSGPMSPPCEPASPPPCDPNVASTPPCATPTPLPTLGVGGQIYIGTPELIDGKIRVPVNTTSAQDPFLAFNAHLVFDGALASVVNPTTDAQPGGVFGKDLFCVRDGSNLTPDLNGTTGAFLACVDIGSDPRGTTGPSTLAYFWLTPRASAGCVPLHIFTYGAPDAGDIMSGSYTIGSEAMVQANTYGPDVSVNIADGKPCSVSPPRARRTATPEHEACADVNDDGRVTPRDATAIAARILGRYRAKYDLNHDGRVNGEDVRIAIRQIGRRC